MILGVDIGNTNITCGIISSGRVLGSWRVSTSVKRTPDEFTLLFRQLILNHPQPPAHFRASVISSVVPPVLLAVARSLKELFPFDPFIIQPGISLNLSVEYARPQDVGADRIVNSVAARHKFGYPLIIIDFGTATTFCVLNRNGNYSGGVIFPGIETISEALSRAAAMLPSIAFKDPGTVIGNSTIHSMQSGLFYGTLEMIEGMVRRVRREIGGNTPVVATGGLAEFFLSSTAVIDHYEPDLILQGLELLYDLNQKADPGNPRWDAS
ncbi:type III pantothenate kinase [bacterium]|nr:type III pantothenate kinase [candidate division CSSED10-310 bacterium]